MSGLALLISPCHDEEDSAALDMLFLTWMTFASLAQREDVNTNQLPLFLITPGLIDDVNCPSISQHSDYLRFQQEQREFTALLFNIIAVAKYFGFKESNIRNIRLSDYLSLERQERLSSLDAEVDTQITPTTLRPTILPLKEIFLNYVSESELTPLFRIIHQLFDCPKTDKTTLPYQSGKKQDIRSNVFDIISQLKSDYESNSLSEPLHCSIENELKDHVSVIQFVTLMDQAIDNDLIPGAVFESLKRIFTTQHNILRTHRDIAQKRKKKIEQSRIDTPQVLPLSNEYLVLESLAMLEMIREIKQHTLFTYICHSGRDEPNNIEKGIAFFSQLVNAQHWYQSSETNASQYQAIHCNNINIDDIKISFKYQLINLLSDVKISTHKLPLSTLKILDPTRTSGIYLQSDHKEVIYLFLEIIGVVTPIMKSLLIEVWNTVKKALNRKELKSFCREIMGEVYQSESSFYKQVEILLKKNFIPQLKKSIVDFILKKLNHTVSQDEIKHKQTLILNWFTLNNKTTLGFQVSDYLLNQLNSSSYADIQIARTLVTEQIWIDSTALEQNLLIKMISESFNKSYLNTIETIQTYLNSQKTNQLKPIGLTRSTSMTPLYPHPGSPDIFGQGGFKLGISNSPRYFTNRSPLTQHRKKRVLHSKISTIDEIRDSCDSPQPFNQQTAVGITRSCSENDLNQWDELHMQKSIFFHHNASFDNTIDQAISNSVGTQTEIPQSWIATLGQSWCDLTSTQWMTLGAGILVSLSLITAFESSSKTNTSLNFRSK